MQKTKIFTYNISISNGGAEASTSSKALKTGLYDLEIFVDKAMAKVSTSYTKD